MDDIRTMEKRYALFAWGALFLLLGLLMIVPGDQGNLFVFLCGLVLLGLNLARSLRGIPVSPFSITLGCLALALGSLGLIWPLLHLPKLEIGFLPLALLVIGLYLVIPNAKQKAEGG